MWDLDNLAGTKKNILPASEVASGIERLWSALRVHVVIVLTLNWLLWLPLDGLYTAKTSSRLSVSLSSVHRRLPVLVVLCEEMSFGRDDVGPEVVTANSFCSALVPVYTRLPLSLPHSVIAFIYIGMPFVTFSCYQCPIRVVLLRDAVVKSSHRFDYTVSRLLAGSRPVALSACLLAVCRSIFLLLFIDLGFMQDLSFFPDKHQR